MASRRFLYAGLGVLALAAALAVSPLTRWGWSSQGSRGPGRNAPSVVARGTVDIDGAVQRARATLAATGFVDLVPAEVMEFSNHFYVLVKEQSTGKGALELIVERNGFVHPEPGPNMMWNTKYGHMAGFGGPGMMGRGMMGRAPGGYVQPPALGQVPAQTITPERARQLAIQYLSSASPGATPDAGTAFYGYFTFDVERDGTIFGMLSVNALTGQVWYHTWHGAFVREKDI